MNIKIKEKIDSFQRVLITGGGGFIGGCLVRTLLKNTSTTIFNFDKMGYASDCTGINNIIEHSKHNDDNFLSNRYTFFRGDLNDQGQLREAFDIAKPNLTIKPANTTETIVINFKSIFREGPAVSLKGSPIVSPTTDALWASVPFPP